MREPKDQTYLDYDSDHESRRQGKELLTPDVYLNMLELNDEESSKEITLHFILSHIAPHLHNISNDEPLELNPAQITLINESKREQINRKSGDTRYELKFEFETVHANYNVTGYYSSYDKLVGLKSGTSSGLFSGVEIKTLRRHPKIDTKAAGDLFTGAEIKRFLPNSEDSNNYPSKKQLSTEEKVETDFFTSEEMKRVISNYENSYKLPEKRLKVIPDSSNEQLPRATATKSDIFTSEEMKRVISNYENSYKLPGKRLKVIPDSSNEQLPRATATKSDVSTSASKEFVPNNKSYNHPQKNQNVINKQLPRATATKSDVSTSASKEFAPNNKSYNHPRKSLKVIPDSSNEQLPRDKAAHVSTSEKIKRKGFFNNDKSSNHSQKNQNVIPDSSNERLPRATATKSDVSTSAKERFPDVNGYNSLQRADLAHKDESLMDRIVLKY